MKIVRERGILTTSPTSGKPLKAPTEYSACLCPTCSMEVLVATKNARAKKTKECYTCSIAARTFPHRLIPL